MDSNTEQHKESETKTGASQMNKSIKILYHANCDDGYGSAWAAYRFFKAQGKLHTVDFIPVKYNEPPPEGMQSTDNIYIVDFSYPREVMLNLIKQHGLHGSITVLDHHKTAEEALRGLPNCTFDMNRSGAMMTWNFFFSQAAPKLIQYIQDNDLWTHKLKHSKQITRYIRSFAMDFEVWDELYTRLEFKMNEVIIEAQGMQSFFQTQLDYAMKGAMTGFVFADPDKQDAYPCPVCNVLPLFTSEGCHLMMKAHDTLIALTYFIDADGDVICSLRSSGEVDVGRLAKYYGGGGHKAAAGFKMTPQSFFTMLYGGGIKG